MTRQYFTLLSFIIFLTSCIGQPKSDETTKFKKEIPTNNDGRPDLFYKLAQQKTFQLHLDTLQGGYDSLQIRIWYDYSLINFRRLLILKRTNSIWSATEYDMKVEWDFKSTTETIKTKETKVLEPKHGWNNFVTRIYALQIMSLPNSNKLKDYSFGDDGTQYSVELATKNQYRFYSYWEPKYNQNKFWQAKNMTDILQLIKEEFNINPDLIN